MYDVRCLPTRRDQMARPKANPQQRPPGPPSALVLSSPPLTSLIALGAGPRGPRTCSLSPPLPQVPRTRANPRPGSGFCHPPANTRHSSEGGVWPGCDPRSSLPSSQNRNSFCSLLAPLPAPQNCILSGWGLLVKSETRCLHTAYFLKAPQGHCRPHSRSGLSSPAWNPLPGALDSGTPIPPGKAVAEIPLSRCLSRGGLWMWQGEGPG